MKGYRRRVRDEYEAKRAHNAWMASVMAHLQGAKITPEELLGKKQKVAKVSDEQNEKNLARLGMLPSGKQDGAEGAAWLLGGNNGG